ncbi:hypothetical protein PN290_14100 [Romboutsia sp. 1001216sp1]|uniref:hypothetical protein n=1 Tax=unclassified Romboutsia TaxID=2626894 RepID=UPI0018A0240F|nr:MULTISPECIES: hypothetical protein [unclassified Romboutsia]MDB8791378.1 hypothetical protein [Romboutsia sp. 1001216sp1]MDB8794808.1 hypothetical protein [Romboutsia sp. 1001216sp1]MDB8797669.1 hypothetical protein [Romboutsia sp. 1001216sp1]MDB8800498.1 hypothetical protein [Romboutsia sp. 1001216sp1]MDB8803347.1 hypothetical protein [Romboutsia sp. 1001216sp1]
MLGIKLKKDVADKVKSFSYENNMTVSEVLEDIISKMFDSVETVNNMNNYLFI